MRLPIPSLLCLCQTALVALSIPSGALQTADSGTDSSTGATSAIATAQSSGPLSDYVPCMFSDDEQGPMRAHEPFQRPLDYPSAERLVDATNVALAKALSTYSQAKVFRQKFDAYLQHNLKSWELIGKTPDQANAHIQAILAMGVETAVDASESDNLLSDREQEANRERAAEALASVVQIEVTSKLVPKKGSPAPTPQELTDAATTAIRNAAHTDATFSQTYLDKVADMFPSFASQKFSSPTEPPESLASLTRKAALNIAGSPYNPSPGVAQAALKDLVGISADTAAKKTEAKKYQPPEDVSCSMAVMSWKETRDIFGRRVANTYVAIQVTLRNLNTKNEFLVHDIQVAIDTGVTPDYFGRFQAGRDKLLVRAVAQRGQSEDRRNVVLNVLQAAGAIAGAASIATGVVEAKDAVAVFQGPFMTGFANIFPDHTVEQLNHINDLVFSASNTSKVLVPVQGSVPLVTFISEKPIEQLPFAWCGHPPQGHMNPERWFHTGPETNCNFNGGTHNPGYLAHYRYGSNGKIIEPVSDKSKPEGPTAQPASQTAGGYEDPDIPDSLPPWDDLQFRDWRGAALRMLQEHTFVVVGGVHIQEVVTQPKFANLDCLTLSTGQVDLSQTKDGMVDCSVTGTGLGLVSAVTIEKGDSKISGKVKAAGDGNSATLTFKPDDLCNTEGNYSLFLTYKSDAQKSPTDLDSGESLLLGKQPSVTSVTFAGNALTVSGACLDQLSTVSLAPQVGEPVVSGTAPTPPVDAKATTVNYTFQTQPPGATSLTLGATYYLTYTNKLQNKPNARKDLTVVPR